MVKVWKMFWSMLLAGFTAAEETVATIGVAARVARQEADGTALILDIDREARIARRNAAARALVAELTAPAGNGNA